MNLPPILSRLEVFPDVLDSAVRTIGSSDLRWKPSPGEWSALEVAAHLADEEELDFRPRLRWTLESAGTPWPAIDPEGWVAERRYSEMQIEEVLARFRRERETSVSWLRTLGPTNWSAVHDHPRVGVISAGDLLASWAAHDALHLRQIARLAWKLAVRDGDGSSVRYAGEW